MTTKQSILTIRNFILCLLAIHLTLMGCVTVKVDIPESSRGYVVYVFSRKTEVMVDYCKSDGISRGAKLDVFKTNVNDLGMNEPVKVGEITIDEIGDKMSKAKVTAFTSSLQMERGDKVYPHPITVVTDDSWMASKKPLDGWKSDPAMQYNFDWVQCEILPDSRLNEVPEIRQFAGETGAKPVWHTSSTSHQGDVYFRRVFTLNARPTRAILTVLCNGKTDVYLNDAWIGEAREWPEISQFNVNDMLRSGRNVMGVHAIRSPRERVAPLLLVALVIQTEFR